MIKISKHAFSRRRFLAVGSVSLAGVWTACSEQICGKTIRGAIHEVSSRVEPAPFKPTPSTWSDNEITAAWLGHSTVLINFYGFKILTDPVLTNRIGAHTTVGTLGPRRIVAPALNTRQLPATDLVLLSHAHMDHLNPATLRGLKGTPQVVTAPSTADLLQLPNLGTKHSLRWGEKTRVRTSAGDAEVRAFEVKHWGARWRYDTYRGYNGYVISRGGKQIIFGGDTAWTESFASLKGGRPYDLAIMPIGAYDPYTVSHCTPEQAVTMANKAGAEYFLPIHHKTFPLGKEGAKEPLRRLSLALERDRQGWSEIGQTFTLGQTNRQTQLT